MSSVNFEGLGDAVKNGGDFLLALYDRNPIIAGFAVIAIVCYPFYAKLIKLQESRFKSITYPELVSRTKAEQSRREGNKAMVETDGGLNE